ncbi:hypothetical protein KBI33_01815 [Candidatus Shapirobacteria bacterium]|nr:hypothetical protein [Candidatus Shapirobacteria bacterium]
MDAKRPVKPEAAVLIDKIGHLAEQLTKSPLDLDHPKFGFMENFKSTLTDGYPLSSKNIGIPIRYVFPRLPEEIFFPNRDDLHLVLTNDSSLFAKQEKQNYLKTPPARRRWYLNNGRLIRVHLRGKKKLNGDLLEILSFLGILRLFRRTGWEEIASYTNENIIPFLSDRTNFEKWQQKKITVSIDWKPERPPATVVLEDQLRKIGLKDLISQQQKPLLLIGNDFSWRLMMFTLLLSPSQFRKLKIIFKAEEEKIKKETKLINDDWLDFCHKYILLTILNKTYSSTKNNQPEINAIYNQIFNQKNFKTIGYQRLLYGKRPPLKKKFFLRSAIGEPVDYWDPKKFQQKLLKDESASVRKFFLNLIQHRWSILSIPYLIGENSAEVTESLIQNRLVDDETVAFVGKAGLFSEENNCFSLKKGDLIWPRKIFNLENDQSFNFPFKNNLFFNIPSADFLTVPNIALQSYPDCQLIKSRQDKNLPLALDMEQFHLLSLKEKFRILPGFYISDLSCRKNYGQENKITTPLDPIRGGLAIWQAMLLVLQQINR